MPNEKKIGIMEDMSDSIKPMIEAETGVAFFDLRRELGKFEYLYKTERFGQLQDRAIAERISLLDYLTLERVHERWQVFPLGKEQLRAELTGMVGFWVTVISDLGLTHIVKRTISPHWSYAYSQYVAAKICGVKYLTIYENIYLENSVVHEGLRDRAIRYGPPGLPPAVQDFLQEMANKISHPEIATKFMEKGSRLKPTITNTMARVHRGLTADREIGRSTKTDMRDRAWSKIGYACRVIGRTAKNYGEFKRLAREYRKRCINPALSADEKGRSIIFFAHLQPEASTAPLAFFYHDARMAVRELIDQGYSVYYKEHPISFLPTIHHNISLTPDYRSVEYYRDLEEMGCKLIDIDTDNNDLLERFDFAATCTGTVAMQAAAKGKWTIAFGATWFAGMPGLVDARDGLNVLPAELKARPSPTLPELLEYFKVTHGFGVPVDLDNEKREYFLALAQLAQEP